MSKKNNVNPNHYKEKGRLRQGEDVVQEIHRQAYGEDKAAGEQGGRNFIPGAAPVGQSEKKDRGGKP
jgi:hypothetical protein